MSREEARRLRRVVFPVDIEIAAVLPIDPSCCCNNKSSDSGAERFVLVEGSIFGVDGSAGVTGDNVGNGELSSARTNAAGVPQVLQSDKTCCHV